MTQNVQNLSDNELIYSSHILALAAAEALELYGAPSLGMVSYIDELGARLAARPPRVANDRIKKDT